MSLRLGLPLLQSHGALHPEALYIERAADQALYQALRAGELCYVLAPRQIGKSSLRVRTARKLSENGARCAELDLTRIGGSADHDPIATWYFSLLANLAEELGLSDPRPFWLAHEGRLPADRLIHYLRQVVLREITGEVVIFLDEIDYLRSLPLPRDELFAALRAVYSERARDATYRRLTFCLLGVAAPSDLIQDPEITPFNIGRPIRLADFSRAELCAFEELLRPLGNVVGWLDEIYRWTGGHPYMTQRLCETLLEDPQPELAPAAAVERCVRTLFLRRGRSADPNLSYAEKRLDSEANRGRKEELLTLYHRLLTSESIGADGDDPLQLELQLCGMVAIYEADGERRLRIRNLIFARVYGLEWLRGKEAQRELMQAQRRWQASGRSASALLRGAELDRGQSFVAQHLRQVTAEEHEFLLISLAGARREAEEQRLAAEAAAERELRRRAEVEAASLRRLNDQLEQALAAAESSRREANQARSEAVLAREQAEAAALTEKSLRAAELATQGETLPQALVLGLQAARPDVVRNSFVPTHWTGLVQAAIGSIVSRSLRGHEGAVRRAMFSPDGRWIVSASGDGTVQLWELGNGTRQSILLRADQGAWSVAISPDSSKVLAASQSGVVYVLDLLTGKTLQQFQAHEADIFSAAYSPDGQCIATASADRTARIWEAATGARLCTLTGHTGDVTDVAFSPDSRRIVTSSADRTARLWNAANGEHQLTLRGHTDQVWSAAFSASGHLIATASWDQTARIWNGSGQTVTVLQGHTDSLWRAAFSPDDSFLVTASDDKTARIWLVSSGQTTTVLLGHSAAVLSAGFAPDKESVLTSSADGTLRLWDTHKGSAARQVFVHDAPVWSVAVSGDGSRVVTGCADNVARIWDTKGRSKPLLLSGHTARIWSAVFSPDATLVATASEDLTVRLWDTASGRCVRELPQHDLGVSAVAFSADGTRLVTAGWDHLARIWRSTDGELIGTLTGHSDRVWTCTFSTDDELIVTGGWDYTARIWSTRSGDCSLTLRGHSGEVMCTAFSPSGKLIVTTSSDRTARVWSVATGETLLILRGHLGDVLCGAFSPDSQRIVTAGWDGVVRIWDANTGRSLLALNLNTGGVLWAAFTPDGLGLVTGSTNGVAAIYPVRHRDFYEHGLRVLRCFGAMPDVPASEIGALLAELTQEELQARSYITVDTRPLLGSAGQVLPFLYFEGAVIQTLLNEVFRTFGGAIEPFTYGRSWVLRDSATEKPFSQIGSAWFKDRGMAADPRTLSEVGLRPGMQLEAVGIPK